MIEQPDIVALRAALAEDPSTDEFPQSDDVARLIAGELDAAQAQALAARALDDPALALQIRVAAAMAAARTVVKDAPAPAANSSAYRRGLVTALFAIAAVAVVFVVTPPPRLQQTDSGALRAGSQHGLEPTRPSATLSRADFTLEWSGGPDGATYALYVTREDLSSVYRVFDLDKTRHTVPADVLAALPSGTRLLWRVVASTPAGRRLHSSAFEVIVR